MTKTLGYIRVRVGSRAAGTLHSIGEGSSFNYDPDWQFLPWVSLAMPPRAASWLWRRGLHPIFDMNLPEGCLSETLKRHFLKHYGKTGQIAMASQIAMAGMAGMADDFFLLGALSGAMKGRIEYACPWFEGRDEKPGELPLAEVLDSQDPELFRRLQDMFLKRSFVSGVQPKVLARLVKKSSFIARDFIVKTWGDEHPYLADNEFFCMTAARRAGIAVPFFGLSADSRLFVVERFDIDIYGHTLGFEELCVLEGKNRSEKYCGSYEGAARTIGTFVSEDACISSYESFFSILALSVLVRNGNAHLKNFGILYASERESRELAPCYDVVTTSVYTPGDLPALTFSGRKFWPNRKQLVDFGVSACNLERKRACDIWDACAQGVADTRQDIISHAHQRPGFRDVADRMVAAWDDGLADRR